MTVCGSFKKGKKFTVACGYGKVDCDSVSFEEDWVICEGTDIRLTYDDEVVGFVKTTKILKTHIISIDENVWECGENV